jgi:hypothetical protein
MVRNHQINISQFHSIECKNNTLDVENNTLDVENNTLDVENNTLNGKNNTLEESLKQKLPYQCQTCYKTYNRLRSLKKHSEQCSLLENPLQCPFCYKQFNFQQNKSRHMKICTKLVSDNDTITKTNNYTSTTNNNNITINNQIAEKIENNNTNIIVFPMNGHTINFLTDHITNKEMRAALKCGDAFQGLQNYIDILFRREENRCISKTDMKSPYCRIHKGNNKWDVAVDDSVFPKFTTNTSEMALEHIENNLNDMKLPKHKIDSISKRYNEIVSQENPSFKAAMKYVKVCLYNYNKVPGK